MRAVRESKGVIVTVSDEEILEAMRLGGRYGFFAEPAAAAALAGVISALDAKTIAGADRVLTMITGSGLKDTRSAIRAGGEPTSVAPDLDGDRPSGTRNEETKSMQVDERSSGANHWPLSRAEDSVAHVCPDAKPETMPQQSKIGSRKSASGTSTRLTCSASRGRMSRSNKAGSSATATGSSSPRN